jgi:hypothetical protein
MLPEIPLSIQEEFDRHHELAAIVFGKQSADKKVEAMNLIKSQTVRFKSLFNECNVKEKAAIQDWVLRADAPLLNKTAFATMNGIAFCSEFSPYMSSGCYVAARRLQEIASLECGIIGWKVFSADLSARYESDDIFDFYFASQQFSLRETMKGLSVYDPSTDPIWGMQAFHKASDALDVQYLYSRFSPQASHVAALLYKHKHPKVKWYAEFSDPVSITTKNEKRVFEQQVKGVEDYTDNYFENLELSVYQFADRIIFTNENQYKFMHAYCSDTTIKKRLEEKRMILSQPSTDSRFCNIVDSRYRVSSRSINIAYFGIVIYHRRNLTQFFKLADKSNVRLHIFTSSLPDTENWTERGLLQIDHLVNALDGGHERISVNEQVSNLEFLNIAQKMDYLYVEDLDSAGLLNPYLPSKLADYLSTGTRIIAKVQEGSVMSKIEHPNLIKITEVTDRFLATLKKAP